MPDAVKNACITQRGAICSVGGLQSFDHAYRTLLMLPREKKALKSFINQDNMMEYIEKSA
jgi:hypothetical protein